MTLVASSIPYTLSVVLYASNGKHITKNYDLQSPDHATALTDAGQIITDLKTVSAGAVASYKLHTNFEDDNFSLPTSDDAEWGEAAMISGKILDHPLKSYTVQIPFPKITLFEDTTGEGRDIVNTRFSDTATTHLYGYLANFQTGGTAFVSDGELAETVTKGVRL